MAAVGIRTNHFGFLNAWRAHICINQGSNGSAIKFARRGQFQKED